MSMIVLADKMLPTLYISSECFSQCQTDISRIVAIMRGLSVLALMLAIPIFALWLGRSAVEQENDNVETCLHLNQDQVSLACMFLLSCCLR